MLRVIKVRLDLLVHTQQLLFYAYSFKFYPVAGEELNRTVRGDGVAGS